MQGLGPCGAGLRGFECMFAGMPENPTPRIYFIIHLLYMEKLLSLAIKAGKLKEVKRKGWMRAGIERVESVAEHSYRTAFMAMLIGDKLKLDVEKMVKMSLIHDIAECITGDITPHEMEKEKKINIEEKAVRELIGDMEYYEIWKEFILGKSEEAKVVYEIDKLEMILQAKEYEKIYGKESLKEFLKEEKKIKNPYLISLVEEIKKI